MRHVAARARANSTRMHFNFTINFNALRLCYCAKQTLHSEIENPIQIYLRSSLPPPSLALSLCALTPFQGIAGLLLSVLAICLGALATVSFGPYATDDDGRGTVFQQWQLFNMASIFTVFLGAAVCGKVFCFVVRGVVLVTFLVCLFDSSFVQLDLNELHVFSSKQTELVYRQ
jgi:hypothetical protein